MGHVSEARPVMSLPFAPSVLNSILKRTMLVDEPLFLAQIERCQGLDSSRIPGDRKPPSLRTIKNARSKLHVHNVNASIDNGSLGSFFDSC